MIEFVLIQTCKIDIVLDTVQVSVQSRCFGKLVLTCQLIINKLFQGHGMHIVWIMRI